MRGWPLHSCHSRLLHTQQPRSFLLSLCWGARAKQQGKSKSSTAAQGSKTSDTPGTITWSASSRSREAGPSSCLPLLAQLLPTSPSQHSNLPGFVTSSLACPSQLLTLGLLLTVLEDWGAAASCLEEQMLQAGCR